MAAVLTDKAYLVIAVGGGFHIARVVFDLADVQEAAADAQDKYGSQSVFVVEANLVDPVA